MSNAENSSFKIQFHRDAEKELQKLPHQDVKRISRAIDLLSGDPHPIGSTKLARSIYYRIRIGNYRVIYDVREEQIMVTVLMLVTVKTFTERGKLDLRTTEFEIPELPPTLSQSKIEALREEGLLQTWLHPA